MAHYWERGVGWRWKLLQDMLSFEHMVKLASLALQEDGSCADKAKWSLGNRGLFTVKDAYRLARGLSEGQVWGGWSSIWKLKVQERIRVFAWIMAHGKLLTNLERWRRTITSCPMCARCGQEEESTIHGLRDCFVARQVWEKMLSDDEGVKFFHLELQDWISWMLRRVARGGFAQRGPERMLMVC